MAAQTVIIIMNYVFSIIEKNDILPPFAKPVVDDRSIKAIND
jgi:hypothetical protein